MSTSTFSTSWGKFEWNIVVRVSPICLIFNPFLTASLLILSHTSLLCPRCIIPSHLFRNWWILLSSTGSSSRSNFDPAILTTIPIGADEPSLNSFISGPLTWIAPSFILLGLNILVISKDVLDLPPNSAYICSLLIFSPSYSEPYSTGILGLISRVSLIPFSSQPFSIIRSGLTW